MAATDQEIVDALRDAILKLSTRVSLEITDPAQPVPILIGSWSAEAELKILITLDRATELAETDAAALLELLNSVEFDKPALQAWPILPNS